jgi:hypothetical protein
MAETERRARGEDSIFYDRSRDRWTGTITVTGYRIMAMHLTELIGNVKLVDLTVRDVQFALGTLAERLSTRSVRLARMILIQAIRNAMVNDLAVRNAAELAAVPQQGL